MAVPKLLYLLVGSIETTGSIFNDPIDESTALNLTLSTGAVFNEILFFSAQYKSARSIETMREFAAFETKQN